MQFASLVSLGLSAWQISNNRLIARKAVEEDKWCNEYYHKLEMRETFDSPGFSSHLIVNYITPYGIYCNAGPAIPIFVLFYIYIIYLCMKGKV